MQIALISANFSKEPEPVFPLGCAYLISAIKKAGHDVSFIDLLFLEGGVESLKRKLLDLKPDVVALSVRNLETIDYPESKSYVSDLSEVIKGIKSAVDVPIIVGGGGFSVASESFLKKIGGDIGIVGEGEEILLKIAMEIEGGSKPDGDKGNVLLSEFNRGNPVILKAPFITQFDKIIPDREEAGQKFYQKLTGCVTLQTKRGCNLRCAYCTYPLIEGKEIRLREPESVVQEIERAVREFEIREFIFVDAIFNNPESHAISVCEEIIKRGIKIKWTAYFRPEFKEKDFFNIISKSGCSGVDATPDSLSDEVLKALQKGLTSDEIESFCLKAKEAGLDVNLNLIFGAPGENRKTIEETIKRVKSSRPFSVIVDIGIRLYPEAPLTLSLAKEGKLDISQVGVEPFYYFGEIGPQNIIDILVSNIDSSSSWIIPGLKRHYNTKLFARMRKHGKMGPIWKFVRKDERD